MTLISAKHPLAYRLETFDQPRFPSVAGDAAVTGDAEKSRSRAVATDHSETSGENNEDPLSAYLVGLAISCALPTLAQQTNTRDPQLRQQLLGSLKN